MPTNRLRCATAATIAGLSVLAGCSDSGGDDAGSGGDYKLVVISDQTGPLASSGIPYAAGIQAYVDQLNEDGGVNGREVSIEVIDGQSVTDPAVSGMQRALSESVIGVTYCCNTSTFAALVPLLSQSSTPIVAISVTDDALYPEPTENVYGIAPTAAQQAEAILAHIKAKLGGSLEGKKVAFLHIDVAYADTMAETLREGVEAEGGTFVAEEKFDFTATSFGSQAQLIAEANPDAVALMGAEATTVAPVQALLTAGLTTQPIVGYSGGNSDLIFETLGVPNFSAVRSSIIPSETSDLGQAAAELGYEDDLGSTFPDGWDMADFLVQGLEKCGEDCDAAALNEVLNDIGEVTGSLETRYGPLESTPDDHTLTSVGQFYTWDPATASVVPDGEPVEFPFP